MVFAWLFVLAILSILGVAAHLSNSLGPFAKPLNAEDVVVGKKVAQQLAPGKFWIAVLRLAGVGALLAWFGFIGVFEHFDASRLKAPDSATGRLIPQSNHGHTVYLPS